LLDAVGASPVVVRDDVSVPLTVSIGAVRTGAALNNLDALVEAADRCLYTAKRDGRNRVSLARGAQPGFVTRIAR
jgi:PleD family two-component response regulator